MLGNYSVTVEMVGFKSAVRSGIRLIGGQTIRQDITLELGEVSEQMTVSASAEILNTTNADVTHTVDKMYYDNLPVVMGADIRLAEALLQLQPGYNPDEAERRPDVPWQPVQSRLNGGQHSAWRTSSTAWLSVISGHNQSHESAPPIESVGEMKVITSTFSAQYGHSSGGTVEYTSKSGTKDLHGSFYEYLANDKLNARGFFPRTGVQSREAMRTVSPWAAPFLFPRSTTDATRHSSSQRGLVEVPLRRAARLRQHDADRCIQDRAISARC